MFIACCIATPWSRISASLAEADQVRLLNAAAMTLRAAGRLGEALAAMRAWLDRGAEARNWKQAAFCADNLSELHLAVCNPKALAEIIPRQFDEFIDRLYPEDQTPDLVVQERMANEAHAKNKLFACIAQA